MLQPRRADSRRLCEPVPAPVPPERIESQGVEPYRGPGRGWYVLQPDGHPFTQDDLLVVWDSFDEAYRNRQIRR